jgi:integrase
VAERLGIGNATLEPPARVHLTDVLVFCNFLRDHGAAMVTEIDPTPAAMRLEVGAALQGLCGLRVQEAYRLTWDRVDLDRGLVEISGEVKNVWSHRVIPVCARALDALRRAGAFRNKSVVRSVGPEPVIVGYQTSEGYSRAIGHWIDEWNPKVRWKSKDLRNALPTWATANGCKNDLWEQYLGHAPSGVTARHYVTRLAFVSKGEQEEIERVMEMFRRQVVRPMEQAFRAQKEDPDVSPILTRSATSNG